MRDHSGVSEAYRLDISGIGVAIQKQRLALKYSKIPRLIQCEVRTYIGGFREKPQGGTGGGRREGAGG